jgi:hypothetical protein
MPLRSWAQSSGAGGDGERLQAQSNNPAARTRYNGGMGRLSYQRLALAVLLLARVAAAQEEDLLAASLRPIGRAELEANLAPLASLPLSYVEAELDPAAARVQGRLRLVVQNREPRAWNEIVLRVYPNAQKGAQLRVFDVQVNGVKAAPRAHGSVIGIAANVAPRAQAVITLSFRGQLHQLKNDQLAPDDEVLSQLGPGLAALQGRPRTIDGFGTFAVGPLGATLADWYPQLAARARGAWDSEEVSPIGDAAHADPGAAIVSLTVPKGWRVFGAGNALGQHPSSASTEVAGFAAAGIRGALGLIASPLYSSVNQEWNGVEVRAVSMHDLPGAQALVGCARTALSSLQRRFGPYPWRSLTLAEASLASGAGGSAMPGVSLVAQTLASNSGAASGVFEFACYHEVAHQWWQAVVGSDSRRAPWMNEALAQYSAVLVVEDAHGGGDAGRAAAEQALQTWIALSYQGMRMTNVPDGKVARPASEFKSAVSFAGLVYGKAPLFFDEARKLMGADAFDATCRAYRQAWAFRAAGPGAWLSQARRVDAVHDLSALERHWWEEEHGDEDIRAPDTLSLMIGLGGGGPDGFARFMRDIREESFGDAHVREAVKQMEKLLPDLAQLIQNQ